METVNSASQLIGLVASMYALGFYYNCTTSYCTLLTNNLRKLNDNLHINNDSRNRPTLVVNNYHNSMARR